MLIVCHVDVPYFAGSIAQCLCDLVYCIFSSYFNEVFYLSKKNEIFFLLHVQFRENGCLLPLCFN